MVVSVLCLFAYVLPLIEGNERLSFSFFTKLMKSTGWTRARTHSIPENETKKTKTKSLLSINEKRQRRHQHNKMWQERIDGISIVMVSPKHNIKCVDQSKMTNIFFVSLGRTLHGLLHSECSMDANAKYAVWNWKNARKLLYFSCMNVWHNGTTILNKGNEHE